MRRRKKGETAEQLRALADRCRSLAAGVSAAEDRERLGLLAKSYEAEAVLAAAAEADQASASEEQGESLPRAAE